MPTDDTFFSRNGGMPNPERPGDPGVLPPVEPALNTACPEPSEAVTEVVQVQSAESDDIPIVVLAEPAKRKPPHPGFWWSVLWCLGFLAVTQVIPVFLIAIVAAVVLVIRDRGNHMSQTDVATQVQQLILIPSVVAAQVLGLIFACVAIRLIVGKDWARRLALRRPSGVHVVLVLLGLPGFMILPGIVAYLAREANMPTFNYQKSLEGMFNLWPAWFGVVLFGIGAGVNEELWFRGFLGRGLVGRYGGFVGVLLTSLLFGLMHMDPPHIVATALMGTALSCIYLWTRSLWMPMLVHFLNNSAGILLTVLGNDRPRLKELGNAPDLNPIPFLIASVILVAAVGWALYRSRVRLVSCTPETATPWQPDYPGVEYPPADSGTVVLRPWPGWLASALVVLALLVCGVIVVKQIPKAGTEPPPVAAAARVS
jgi:membrane protease YdiL (CAAX protease family)